MLRTVPWVGLIPLFALGVAFHLWLDVYAEIRGLDAQLTKVNESLELGR